jgi:hypothetical protein
MLLDSECDLLGFGHQNPDEAHQSEAEHGHREPARHVKTVRDVTNQLGKDGASDDGHDDERRRRLGTGAPVRRCRGATIVGNVLDMKKQLTKTHATEICRATPA